MKKKLSRRTTNTSGKVGKYGRRFVMYGKGSRIKNKNVRKHLELHLESRPNSNVEKPF